MGYLAGTADNAAEIIAAIASACVLGGWSHVGDVISKGDVHTRLTTPLAGRIKVEGANDADFTDYCTWAGYVAINSWPVSYRIFVNEDPDACFAHIKQADGATFQYIMFGMIENKVGDWVGGNFFCASRDASSDALDPDNNGTFTGSYITRSGLHGAPFASGGSELSGHIPSPDGLHIELFDYNWADSSLDAPGTTHVEWPRFLNPLNLMEPNLWNGQAVMLQPHLYIAAEDGRWSRIGTLPHMRALRLTNYETYDVVTMGEEQWMVGPWVKKDTTEPNAPTGEGHSGTQGFAVRYTP
jgi:hypothetical protein